MKLYQFIFDKKNIRKYVYEVEEKKKIFKIINGRLEERYLKQIDKNDIEKVICNSLGCMFVILMEDDEKKAKRFFAEYFYGKINENKKNIDEMSLVIKKYFLESEE